MSLALHAASIGDPLRDCNFSLQNNAMQCVPDRRSRPVSAEHALFAQLAKHLVARVYAADMTCQFGLDQRDEWVGLGFLHDGLNARFFCAEERVMTAHKSCGEMRDAV